MRVNIGPYPKDHKKKRKIEVKVDHYDVWGADSTLAYIILPVLKHLKKVKHGVPNTDLEDVPKELRKKGKAESDEDFQWSQKRWDYILDQMIWAFDQYNKDWESQFHSGKIDRKWVELPETKDKPKEQKLYSWEKGPKHTHKFDKKGYQKHWGRIQNGLRLFAKYYSALWD